MKKVCLILLLGFFSYTTVAQSQLRYLKLSRVTKVIEFLEDSPDAVLYTGCAYKDIARKLKIESVRYEPASDKSGYFVIIIKGVVIGTFNIVDQEVQNYYKTSTPFSEIVDIAYVHVPTTFYDDPSGKRIYDATCLGIYLGFECDPCIDPFDYPNEPD